MTSCRRRWTAGVATRLRPRSTAQVNAAGAPRATRGVADAAGAVLAGHGRVIDSETQRAAAGLAAMLGQLSLRLRIGAFQAAALHLLPPALTALRHRHPDADLSIIDITSDRGVPAVATGELDLAVIAPGTPRPARPSTSTSIRCWTTRWS